MCLLAELIFDAMTDNCNEILIGGSNVVVVVMAITLAGMAPRAKALDA